MAGITGNLYLAKRKAAALPDVIEKLDVVERLSFSAGATIQQLLAFSRKGIVKMHPFNVAAFLKEVVKLQQVTIPENISLELELELEQQELNVKGDINQLQQALMNLINNAIDAVKDSASPLITLSLQVYAADEGFYERHPEQAAAAHFAAISIRDNGCGIAQEDMEHLFEPFFTTKEVGKGSGLGLAMVYGTLKTHGGTVEVASEAGAGTEFTLYLPLIEAAEDAAMAEEGDFDLLPGSGETVLLADDNETVLNTGKEVLEGLGYSVMTAQNGEQAVSLYEHHRDQIDAVILDVVMPIMGGVTALRKIRAVNPDAAVMFATGYDKLTAESGDDALLEKELVISKPFTVNNLSRKLYLLLHRDHHRH